MNLFLTALVSGGEICSHNDLRRVIDGSKAFAEVGDDTGAVPLTFLGVLSLVERQAFVGASFALLEGSSPRMFLITSVVEQFVKARELARRGGSLVDAPVTLKFPVAALASLWLSSVETMSQLATSFILPVDYVSAAVALSTMGEPVLKLWRGGAPEGRACALSVKMKSLGGGVGSRVTGEDKEKLLGCNVPAASRVMFAQASLRELFEGKSRVVSGVRAIYATCMLEGSGRVPIGDDRFDVDMCLYVHLPHGELQDVLRFVFPGLRFFQTCSSEEEFSGYVEGSTKAAKVPRLVDCAGALEALDNFVILLQRVFSKFTQQWEEAWCKLRGCSERLARSKSLPDMDHNGLLAAVLDRVLAGFFRALARPSVTELEVLEAMDLLQFNPVSSAIKSLNEKLTGQPMAQMGGLLGQSPSVLGKRNTEDRVDVEDY